MTSQQTDIRVVVVAEDHLARAGLAALLDTMHGCTVAGQASPKEYGSVSSDVFGEDVVVWDLGWDPDRSLECIGDATDGGALVLALVTDERGASDAWNAGVRGLLHRDAGPSALAGAIVAVAQGLSVLDPQVAPAIPAPRPTDDRPELTRRELEVLGLIADGHPNKAIAARLQISEHTVKFHVTAILEKLGAQSRTEAVTRATRAGLITL